MSALTTGIFGLPIKWIQAFFWIKIIKNWFLYFNILVESFWMVCKAFVMNLRSIELACFFIAHVSVLVWYQESIICNIWYWADSRSQRYLNPKRVKELLLLLFLVEPRQSIAKIKSLVHIDIGLDYLVGLSLLDHIYWVKGLLVDFKVLFHMAYFNVLNVIEHIDKTCICNFAETRLVEFVPLSFKRLFVGEIKDGLWNVVARFFKLDRANKVGILIVTNMLVLLLLTE